MKGNNPIDKLRAQLRTQHGTPWQDRRQKVEAKGIPDEELKRLRELADAATEGPWRVVGADGYATGIWGPHAQDVVAETKPMRQEDARLLVAARTAVPALLDEVARLKAVALTFEDEADRLGGELKKAQEEVRRLQEQRSNSTSAVPFDIDAELERARRPIRDAKRAERERCAELVADVAHRANRAVAEGTAPWATLSAADVIAAIRALPDE